MAEEQPPEVKAEARQFMSDLISGPPPAEEFTGNAGIDMAAWRKTYVTAADSSSSSSSATLQVQVQVQVQVMEKFWSMYDPTSTSIWTCTYDYAEDNETLNDTIDLAAEFIKKCDVDVDVDVDVDAMKMKMKDHCFGHMHVLDDLSIVGVWIFNGPDPEHLFGSNEDTSWYTWSQIGPDANDLVKKAVANLLAPSNNQLKGKTIKNTQAFV